MPSGSIAALALSVAVLGGAASAQTPPPGSVYPAPRFLSGFTHPDITECKTISATRRECGGWFPPRSAARYLRIEAAWAVATATSPDAAVGA